MRRENVEMPIVVAMVAGPVQHIELEIKQTLTCNCQGPNAQAIV
jgi:hypothetical protein